MREWKTVQICGNKHPHCGVCRPDVQRRKGDSQRGTVRGKIAKRVYKDKKHRHPWCRTCNPTASAKASARLKKEHAAGLRPPALGPCTGIQQKLIAFLRASGLEGLEMEVPFGRYRVDVYCRSRHLAFEADGEAWHEGHPFRDQVSRDLERDEYLLKTYELPVIRLTGSEIEDLMPASQNT